MESLRISIHSGPWPPFNQNMRFHLDFHGISRSNLDSTPVRCPNPDLKVSPGPNLDSTLVRLSNPDLKVRPGSNLDSALVRLLNPDLKVSPESNLDSIHSIFQGPGPNSSTFPGLLVESGYVWIRCPRPGLNLDTLLGVWTGSGYGFLVTGFSLDLLRSDWN